MVMEETRVTNFEHLNVQAIDPAAGRSGLPAGPGYTFELVDAGLKTKEETGNVRMSLGFAVVADPNNGQNVGSRQYLTIWPDDKFLQKKTGILAGQTGIQQTSSGEAGVQMWLEALKAARPRFTGAVRGYSKGGQTVTEIDIFSLRATS